MSARRRLLLVQYAGDFREADRVLRETGQETYYNHRHVLETLAEVQRTTADTTIMCCRTTDRYHVRLESGVTAVGAAADPFQDPERILAEIRAIGPTDVIFLGPMSDVIGPTLSSGARVTCMWADSFDAGGVRARLSRRRVRRQLNDPRIDWVANHGRNACRSLLRMGVSASKVFPWDYTHLEDPEEYPAKTLPDDAAPRLFFAGLIVDSKGVFDVVDAVALLRRQGVPAEVRIAGSGEDERLAKRVAELGISDVVTVLGLLPNTEVLSEMRAATAVVVPSRPDYPEGQPLTINEALRARTPIVASDHPMFDRLLVDGTTAVTFAAGDARALAASVQRLHQDGELYRRLSLRAPETWRYMGVEAKWGDLVRRWARNAPEDRRWFADRVREFAASE